MAYREASTGHASEPSTLQVQVCELVDGDEVQRRTSSDWTA